MVKYLCSILPITVVNVEDIKAVSKGKRKWDASFSPLEVGKKWFYSEIENLGLRLVLTEGFNTKTHRDNRGFAKSKDKLDYIWETHNVDTHCLVEMVLGNIEPFYGIYKAEFLQYHRRQLHVQQPIKGNIRKPYGTTVSLGMPRGSIVRCKDKLAYLGGSSNGKVSIHSILSGKRISTSIKAKDIQLLYTNNRRMQFLSQSKPWNFLHIFL
jgi:hypothetical protein